MTRSTWDGARVLVMGLGLFGGGAGAARYLAERGARVRVTDLRSADDLAPSVAALDGLEIAYRLGEHQLSDFTDCDVVVANPGVPHASPWLAAARENGVRVTTEVCLFVDACAGRIAAVTGTSGKTTTAHLLFRMLRGVDCRTLLGGNVGGSLLDRADHIDTDAWVVLELSSFQLHYLGGMGWRPHLAVATNLRENHLDWHGSYAHYAGAKRQIIAHQGECDAAVLNAEDPEVAHWRVPAGVRARFFSSVPSDLPGVCVKGGAFVSSEHGPVCPVAALRVPGRHNLSNAAAASCAALMCGGTPEIVSRVLADFEGVPHRLETVGERDGVRWVNDSIATSPDRTAVALEAFEGPIVLIAGGYDKKLSYASVGAQIGSRVRDLILLGDTAEAIARSIPAGSATRVHRVADLEAAVAAARAVATAGDTVLLSPASASYGMFRNFEERGAAFRRLARASA